MSAPSDISTHAAIASPVSHRALAILTLGALLVHGYHPFAEDGGAYAAGVESALDPSLFSHDLAFVQSHRAYSLFDPALALAVRALHLPLGWVLLLAHIGCLYLLLYAVGRLAAAACASARAPLFATATLAAAMTVPVAGTALFLMDPYLTGRSFSTPLCLLAFALVIPSLAAPLPSRNRLPWLRVGACLLAAASMHLLMTAYAVAFLATLLVITARACNTRHFLLAIFPLAALAAAAILQAHAAPETPAMLTADLSRQYWFVSTWQWYEWLGLAGPLIVIALLAALARHRLTPIGIALCKASLLSGAIAVLIALLFTHPGDTSHLIARFQPLRAFLVPYALMMTLLGALLAEVPGTGLETKRKLESALPAIILASAATLCFYAQRQSFPASAHLELPWRAPRNPWSQAFLWAASHTPNDALIAIDATYITTRGEDAQNLRAIAKRSMLCDFSKDGGVAANHPELAATWLEESKAQQNLSALSDRHRDARLYPFGVRWMILRADANTSHVCPYGNGTVKVCSMAQAPN